MKYRVVDFETTGRPEDRSRGKPVAVCEIGWTDLGEDDTISQPTAFFVDPGMPMPPEARAVHHISDDDLLGAVDPGSGFMLLMKDMEPGDIFVAHQIEFERTFFGGGGHPWICTLKCAKHLFEDLPSYSNQALRYELDVDREFDAPAMAMPPHRAGPDTYVTAHILRHELRRCNGDATRLVEITRTPILLKTVDFGKKYPGRPWSEVDDGYLQFVIDGNFDDEVKYTARHWLKSRRAAGNPFAS